jgi:thioredoxin-dependent peroxiredoxin
MAETVTLKGQAFTLKGNLVKEGQEAPQCELVGGNLSSVKLSSFKGKALLLISVPSLDTDVCSRETHRFNQEIDKFKDQLSAVCVSMDLPFAQSRWCQLEGIKNVTVLSDYKNHEFGEKYGVLIPELGLLARCVFLIDPNMKIQMVHLVKEVTQEPNYEIILEKINQLLKTTHK